MKKNSLTTAVVAGIAGVAGFAGLASADVLLDIPADTTSLEAGDIVKVLAL